MKNYNPFPTSTTTRRPSTSNVNTALMGGTARAVASKPVVFTFKGKDESGESFEGSFTLDEQILEAIATSPLGTVVSNPLSDFSLTSYGTTISGDIHSSCLSHQLIPPLQLWDVVSESEGLLLEVKTHESVKRDGPYSSYATVLRLGIVSIERLNCMVQACEGFAYVVGNGGFTGKVTVERG